MGRVWSGMGAVCLLFFLSACGRDVPRGLPAGTELKYSVSVEQIQRNPDPQPSLDIREFVTVWGREVTKEGQEADVRLEEQFGSPSQNVEWGDQGVYWGKSFFSTASRSLRQDIHPAAPEVAFPWWIALPRSRSEADRGWSEKGEGDRIYAYRLEDGSSWGDRRWIIGRTTDSFAMERNGEKEWARFVFDRDRGCLTEIEMRTTYSRDFRKEYRVDVRLDGFRKLSGEEQARIRHDAEACRSVMAAFDAAAQWGGEADEAVVHAGIAGFREKALELPTKVITPEFRQDAAVWLRTSSESGWEKLIVDVAVRKARLNEAGLNRPSPDWTWPDLNGKMHSLRDYRGKVVLLDFWGIFCLPCLQAMPELQRLADGFRGRPVEVIGVNRYDGPAEIGAMTRRLGVSYAQLVARQGNPYVFEGVPTLILIDADGMVRYRHTDFALGDEKELQAKIEGLLRRGGL